MKDDITYTDQMEMEYYIDDEKLLVAVDCIIFGFDKDKLKLLAFKRRIDPFHGQWSLLGTFVRKNENIDDAAYRVLNDLTGRTDTFLEQLHTFGDINRDPGNRVISVTYWSLVKIEDYDKENNGNKEIAWFPINELPHLVLDHQDMVSKALDKLRRNSRYRPLGFELLPEKFTLPQLLKLYQEIYQQDLDDRNFRKKILSMNLLEKLPEKDKSTSKKGAFLYQFDKEKYQELVEKGFNFEL